MSDTDFMINWNSIWNFALSFQIHTRLQSLKQEQKSDGDSIQVQADEQAQSMQVAYSANGSHVSSLSAQPKTKRHFIQGFCLPLYRIMLSALIQQIKLHVRVAIVLREPSASNQCHTHHMKLVPAPVRRYMAMHRVALMRPKRYVQTGGRFVPNIQFKCFSIGCRLSGNYFHWMVFY